MLMTESPKQAALRHCQKKAQNKQFIMLMAESPKQAELMVIAKSPKQAISSYLWPTSPEQAAHLISSGNGSWPLMAGLNKIMKDDEII